MRASLAEHREIVAAFARADGEAACEAMRRHVFNTADCAGIKIGKSQNSAMCEGEM